MKQTKQTQKLARKIRRLREKKRKRMIWKAICEKLDIRTEDGRPDPGLAYKLAYQDYEPSDRAVRQRLHLRDLCVKCKRTFPPKESSAYLVE